MSVSVLVVNIREVRMDLWNGCASPIRQRKKPAVYTEIVSGSKGFER
jgi:hypothetical protein